jgi:glycosyltransferase involved in cell wall biosynthesis
MMATLGLAIITQNEEIHIPATIAQFYHCVEDMVVVNGGSTDKTAWWAEKMGARVIFRPFSDDFSDQKNFACSQLDTDWVYLHDPDERLEPQTLELLPLLTHEKGQRLLMDADVIPESEDLFDCFGFARRNFIDGVQTEVYPDYQYRLFKPNCKFVGKVHEQITGFEKRTEVDYRRPDATRPKAKEKGSSQALDTERGQIETGVNPFDPAQISRFNILHYKSSSKQKEQDAMYRRIRGE